MMGLLDYWNRPTGQPKELAGCYPMGGGGLTEAIYRNYFELQHLRKVVPLHESDNFLELGSGNGRWAVGLARHVASYTAVDFSARMMAIARQSAHEAGIDNIRFIERSITEYVPDQRYDIVYFSGISQYLDDKALSTVLDRLYPWLAHDACLVDRSTVNTACRETVRIDDYESTYRTPEEIARIFSRAGFAPTYRKRSYRFLRLGKVIRRLPLSWLMQHDRRAMLPLICHGLRTVSWMADCIHPVPFEGGLRSHDLQVFRRVQ